LGHSISDPKKGMITLAKFCFSMNMPVLLI
jgi:hypothetical protein